MPISSARRLAVTAAYPSLLSSLPAASMSCARVFDLSAAMRRFATAFFLTATRSGRDSGGVTGLVDWGTVIGVASTVPRAFLPRIADTHTVEARLTQLRCLEAKLRREQTRVVDLSWAMGGVPNDLIDPYLPFGWLNGEDIPRLLYSSPRSEVLGRLSELRRATGWSRTTRISTASTPTTNTSPTPGPGNSSVSSARISARSRWRSIHRNIRSTACF